MKKNKKILFLNPEVLSKAYVKYLKEKNND